MLLKENRINKSQSVDGEPENHLIGVLFAQPRRGVLINCQLLLLLLFPAVSALPLRVGGRLLSTGGEVRVPSAGMVSTGANALRLIGLSGW
jgi:hypothetical protein